MRTLFTTLALSLWATGSAAITLDFIKFSDFNEQGVDDGTTISSPSFGGLDLTFSSNYYAYFDHGNAGLGVCQVVNNPGAVGSTGRENQCNTPVSGASDDNVTFGESVTVSWLGARTLGNILFRAEGHGSLTTRQTLLFSTNGGGLERYSFGELASSFFTDVTSMTFAFDDNTFTLADARGLDRYAEQFYVASAIVGDDGSLSEVPLPAGLPLLMAGLVGLGLVRRRKDV